MSSIIAYWGCFWLIVLCAVYQCSRKPGRKGLLLCGLGFAVFLGLCSGLLMIFLPAVVLFVVAARWPSQPARPAALTLTSTLIVAAFSAPAISAGLLRLAELRQWQREFPLQSLAPRLAYEIRPVNPSRVTAPTSPAALAHDVEARLTRMERQASYSPRSYALQQLHDETRAEFEALTGFGPIRMLSLERGSLELPPGEPVPQPARPDRSSDNDPFWTGLDQGVVAATPAQDAMANLHDVGLEDFLDPERMGYVVDREHVAGFASHKFSQLPEFGDRDQTNVWDVERLELIGLLSHDRPVVYVSEFLPDLEELGDAAVRELDDFERDSLVQLRSERDVVTAEFPPRLRMLGALRAGQSCLDCHNVQRGDLLGAFSYVISPRHNQPAEPVAVID